MDILRKELNALYSRQRLDLETLPAEEIGRCMEIIRTLVATTSCYAVLTDIAHDCSWLFMPDKETGQVHCEHCSSSDEDAIYCRIHPTDLVDKRMLEYRFFQFIESTEKEATPQLSDCEIVKLSNKAVCRIRIKNKQDKYVYVDNSTQVLRTSPEGKMWLILCCYSLSPYQQPLGNIGAHIVNPLAQQIIPCSFARERDQLLSTREKEILRLIQAGKQSKEIADILHISLFTVSRHRQNILQKFSVNNSMEAVNAATRMELI